jgi:hypothetical protein
MIPDLRRDMEPKMRGEGGRRMAQMLLVMVDSVIRVGASSQTSRVP